VEGKSLADPAVASNDEDELYFLEQEHSVLIDDKIRETFQCYLNIPEIHHTTCNPLNYAHIHEQQQQDEKLLALQAKYPDNYFSLQLDDNVDDIICYKNNPTQDDWKIALPGWWLTLSSGSTK
jgi:hypothetical protein